MDSPQATVTLELMLRVGSEPITGALRGADGRTRPFVGWVALVRSLEDAITPVDSEEKP
ncbi:MAG TPA: hypothetical protein VHZ54_04310 [Solirubrobacterales bacterium]|jgi:hypothetical protein|nr:hypothetical protein [Solirubrobacterales bacterium]